MSLEELRLLALDYKPEALYSVCLDRGLQASRVELQARLVAAYALRGKATDADPVNGSTPTLGEKSATQALDEQIATLEAELNKVEDEALPKSITLVFSRLPLTRDGANEGEESYEQVVERLTVDDRIDTDHLADELLRKCYLRTEAASGDGDVSLTWREAAATLGRQDITMLRSMIIGHHEMGAAVPFDPRTSGRRATT